MAQKLHPKRFTKSLALASTVASKRSLKAWAAAPGVIMELQGIIVALADDPGSATSVPV
jgi:hypothetical protein